MKHTFYLILFLLLPFNINPSNQLSPNPLLVVVIMVKNEESFMIPTLKPFVEGGIKSFIVFDTGSTDKTIDVTRRYFNTNGIDKAYIFQEPFIDFATSRNRALEFAEKKFPNAGFFLMPDAEWYFENVAGLLAFCTQEIQNNPVEGPHSYLIKLISNIDFYQQRLIRNGRSLRFAGVVHETISQGTNQQVPNEIHFRLGASRQGLAKTRKRWPRDKELLLNEHRKHPNDPRTAFYLAQTCLCLGELEEAYKYYSLRTTLGGFKQEIADSLLKLGKIASSFIKNNQNNYNWTIALNHFLQSYSLRPWCAEPLIEIARYYIDNNELELAYLFLRRAIEIPYPENEILFVEKLPYMYDRYDLLGRCAWKVGDFELGEWAIRQALTVSPHAPHLHHNLAFYLTNKKKSNG